MLNLIKSIALAGLSFSAGMVIAGAVYAFIAVVGIVPRLAQKTGTEQHIKIYEEAIIFGGIFGTITEFFKIRLPISSIGAMLFSLGVGVFYGCLAVSLAEVLKVIPILTRRGRIMRGMVFFVLAIALGKLAGSVLYYSIDGFYKL